MPDTPNTGPRNENSIYSNDLNTLNSNTNPPPSYEEATRLSINTPTASPQNKIIKSSNTESRSITTKINSSTSSSNNTNAIDSSPNCDSTIQNQNVAGFLSDRNKL